MLEQGLYFLGMGFLNFLMKSNQEWVKYGSIATKMSQQSTMMSLDGDG